MKKSGPNLEKNYNFNISNADQIYDYLLPKKEIKLLDGHIMPTTEGMKNLLCKWHDMWTYQTVYHVVLRNTIIDNGDI